MRRKHGKKHRLRSLIEFDTIAARRAEISVLVLGSNLTWRPLSVELGDEHWTVLNAARAIDAESGSSPGLRKISKRSETPINKLFPEGPAKAIVKIAGIPKPKSCL